MGELEAMVGGVLAVLLLTAFVRCFTALTILRLGIGVHGSGFGLVVAALSLVLALFVATPQLRSLNSDSFPGIVRLLGGASSKGGAGPTAEAIEAAFMPVLQARADHALIAKLSATSDSPVENASEGRTTSFPVLVAAYLISELREAFRVGLLFLIPFIVLDLIVVNIVAVLAITQIRAEVIALPLKLLVFVALDGWALITLKLIGRAG